MTPDNPASVAAAQARFEALWHEAQVALRNGTVEAAVMRGGRTVPVDYCVSTVARVVSQPRSARSALQRVVSALRADLPTQFYYDVDSWHITLLGCTPRVPHPDAIDDRRRQEIADVCRRTLSGRGTTAMRLRGLNLVGNQVFVQVFPETGLWASLRERLQQALEAAGEQPAIHADRRPVHLNIMRVTDAAPERRARLHAALTALRDADIGRLTVETVECVLTDFVLSDVTPLARIRLAPA